jgi:hypothetical protein
MSRSHFDGQDYQQKRTHDAHSPPALLGQGCVLISGLLIKPIFSLEFIENDNKTMARITLIIALITNPVYNLIVFEREYIRELLVSLGLTFWLMIYLAIMTSKKEPMQMGNFASQQIQRKSDGIYNFLMDDFWLGILLATSLYTSTFILYHSPYFLVQILALYTTILCRNYYNYRPRASEMRLGLAEWKYSLSECEETIDRAILLWNIVNFGIFIWNSWFRSSLFLSGMILIKSQLGQ